MILEKRLIEEEIKTEEAMLDFYKKIADTSSGIRLIAKNKRGYKEFYYCCKGKKRKYLSKNKVELQKIYLLKFAKEVVKVLENNLIILRTANTEIAPYDTYSINMRLPKTYREAYDAITAGFSKSYQKIAKLEAEDQEVLNIVLGAPVTDEEFYSGSLDPNKIYQSHDYRYPDGLIHKVSNGLFVRSKGEMLIAEMLIVLGIKFRYEEPLVLDKVETDEFGFQETKRIVIHPDFTIYLADGTKLYWEHFGMMENQDYRNKNLNKIDTYLQNGIYIPNMLIITMDSDVVPFDNQIVRGIIESRILPRI